MSSTKVTNPELTKIGDVVPLSNPVNTLILLCICSANLKSEGQFWQESRKTFKFGFWQTLLAEF
jgi:hypothetical protein